MSSGERTQRARRGCVIAPALALIVLWGSANEAGAQTVMVRSAAPGARIEAVVDATPAGSATANANGEATIVIPATAGKTDAEANIFVDACAGNLRRVLIVERGRPAAPPGDGCTRKDVQGLYSIRRVSTVVVTMSEPNPRVLLRQGSYSFKPPRVFGAPRGLIIFGSGGLTKVSDVTAFSCGDVQGCSDKPSGWGLGAGVEYWVTPWLGAEGSYLKPKEATAAGTGENYEFDSSFKADVFTIAAKVGVPIGRVRLYGKIGGDYHDATFITEQLLKDRTITVADAPVTIKGGRQTYALRTQGWGWTYGGGLEVWTAPAFGLHLEAGRAQLKGKGVDNADGFLEDGVNYAVLGIRIKVW